MGWEPPPLPLVPAVPGDGREAAGAFRFSRGGLARQTVRAHEAERKKKKKKTSRPKMRGDHQARPGPARHGGSRHTCTTQTTLEQTRERGEGGEGGGGRGWVGMGRNQDPRKTPGHTQPPLARPPGEPTVAAADRGVAAPHRPAGSLDRNNDRLLRHVAVLDVGLHRRVK